MKKFECGSVIPKCNATFEAQTDAELFEKVEDHARKVHKVEVFTPELVEQVRANIEITD